MLLQHNSKQWWGLPATTKLSEELNLQLLAGIGT
jgi:hypothetical protein